MWKAVVKFLRGFPEVSHRFPRGFSEVSQGFPRFPGVPHRYLGGRWFLVVSEVSRGFPRNLMVSTVSWYCKPWKDVRSILLMVSHPPPAPVR